jgi:hypothetical protein
MRHGVGGGNEPSLINYLDALNCGRAAASDAARAGRRWLRERLRGRGLPGAPATADGEALTSALRTSRVSRTGLDGYSTMQPPGRVVGTRSRALHLMGLRSQGPVNEAYES